MLNNIGTIYKIITLFSFKTMAFGIDFFVILFYTIYFFHPNIATRLVEGKLQYLLDAGGWNPYSYPLWAADFIY